MESTTGQPNEVKPRILVDKLYGANPSGKYQLSPGTNYKFWCSIEGRMGISQVMMVVPGVSAYDAREKAANVWRCSPHTIAVRLVG